ncbi:MAG: SlyX [Pseudomonadota bacterium]|jgi:SlyX protein
MTLEARIEDLEIKLAHLERALQDVSDEVVRQQAAIERLGERNLRLQERIEAMQPEGGEDAATRVEIPPHY